MGRRPVAAVTLLRGKEVKTAILLPMTRKKTTVYLEDDLLTAVRVLAASTGRHDYEVVEDALRLYMRRRDVASSRARLRELLDRVAERSEASEEQVLADAYSEVKAHRRSRRGAQAS
jgi:hypothetical protein